MKEQLRALIARHCEALRADLVTFETALTTLADEPEPDTDRLAACIATAHRLKGTSGTVGFDAISTAARDLEMLLRSIESGALAFDGPAREMLSARFETLKALAIAAHPEQSRLYNIDFEAINWSSDKLPGGEPTPAAQTT